MARLPVRHVMYLVQQGTGTVSKGRRITFAVSVGVHGGSGAMTLRTHVEFVGACRVKCPGLMACYLRRHGALAEVAQVETSCCNRAKGFAMRETLRQCLCGFVFLSLACTNSGGRKVSTSPDDSAMTARYEELVKDQLTSSDPHAAQVAIICETDRLMTTYGVERASAAIDAAAARALTPETRGRVRSIDSQLANHVFEAGEGCDSLGRAGVLGGPWPGDTARGVDSGQHPPNPR